MVMVIDCKYSTVLKQHFQPVQLDLKPYQVFFGISRITQKPFELKILERFFLRNPVLYLGVFLDFGTSDKITKRNQEKSEK